MLSPALTHLILTRDLWKRWKVLVAHLCPALCNPMDCKPTRLLRPGDFPGKNTGVGCHFLLQGILPTQGLSPSLLHRRQILYHLSYQESSLSRKVGWACLFLLLLLEASYFTIFLYLCLDGENDAWPKSTKWVRRARKPWKQNHRMIEK